METNNFSLRFYHVEQAKRYASFLAAYINRDLSEEQFSKLTEAINILKSLTTQFYETKTK